ncbi:MAG TPA: TIGR00730 family Rossman fold protein [Thermoanaerobaculia bacterium]|nr:TIGR00730 family Rossman fold protein [Thermoanaerobaculia bacterium]
MKALCVFCGSNPGASPDYARAAARMGALLAERGLTLIYGGGHVGLMGVLADAALKAGGRVIGVIPEALEAREVAHTGLTELRVVRSMHERKALMSELADGFIALPGGIGTMEEWFEVWTWGQLGIHPKPLGMLNVAGYYDHLLAFFDRMVADGFLPQAHRSMAIVGEDGGILLDRLATYVPPRTEKWLDRGGR